MRTRIYIIFALVMLVTGLLGYSQTGVHAQSTELYVDAAGVCAGNTPCYRHPQDAVNAANPGDTILVYPGTYGSRSSACPSAPNCTDSDTWAPALIVYKDNLTIQSVAGPANTIIQSTHTVSSNAGPVERSTANGISGIGGWNASAAIIVANNVTMDGFTFHRPFNCGEINACFWNTAGVFIGGQAVLSTNFLGKANGATVKNSLFSNVWQAVTIWHSKDNTVTGNSVAALGNTGHAAAISAYDGYDTQTISLVPQSQNLLIQNNSLVDKGVSLGADASATSTSSAGSKICANSLTQVVVANSHGPVLAGGNTGTFLQLNTTDVLNISGISYTGPVTSTKSTVTLSAKVAYAGSVDGSGIPVSFNVNGADHAAVTTVGGSASLDVNLPDGTYPISVTYSACGTYTASASLLVNTDFQGPLVTSLVAVPNPLNAGAPLVITATLDDSTTGGSSIASAQYTLDGGSPLAMTGTFNTPVVSARATLLTLGLGTHTICVTGTDEHGNTGPASCTQVSVVAPPDLQGPPVTSLVAVPSSAVVGTPIVITATLDDSSTGGSAIAGAQYALDGAGWLPMTGTFNTVVANATITLPDLGLGVHNVCVKGTDVKGNSGPEGCIPVTVLALPDTQGPLVTSLVAAPSSAVVGTPLVITAVLDDTTTGGSAVSGAQYTVDGGSPLPMQGTFNTVVVTATATLSNLPIGAHSICVTGTDAKNNTGPESCIQVTLTEQPDTQGPLVTSLLVAPASAVVGTPVVITAVVDDSTTGGSIVAGAKYALDGGSWLPLQGSFNAAVVSATVTLPDLSVGAHSICVLGTDAKGNTGPQSCTQVSVLTPPDTQGPLVTSLVAAPGSSVVGTPVVITATLDDTTTGGSPIVSAQYALDGADWLPLNGTFDTLVVSATTTLSNLSLGNHSLCVSATDAQSNSGPEKCIQITIVAPPDTQGPLVTSLVAAPGSAVVGTPIVLTATLDDTTTGGSTIAAAQYAVDGGSWQSMQGTFNGVVVTATVTLSDLPIGEHSLCVTGTDAKDNTGPERCTSVRVVTPPDTQGPLVTQLEAAPNPVIVGTPLVITASLDDSTTGGSIITNAQYALDGGGWLAMQGSFDAVAVSATVTLSDLSLGEHSLCVSGTDVKGNTGPEKCIQVTVELPPDTQGPLVTSLVTTPSFVVVGTPLMITAVVDDSSTGASAVAAAQYAVDGGDWLPMDGPFDAVVVTATASLPDLSAGEHSICVSATDVKGNTGPESCTQVTLYSPSSGAVTANGWFISPAGAYAADPALSEKAHFNLQVKTKKGADRPTGSLKFQLKSAGFSFDSAGFDWLVLDGSKILLKGSGVVNGESGYAFMLTAIQGADTLRLQIWDPASGQVLYDNQPGADASADPLTPLCGGSIVIHK